MTTAYNSQSCLTKRSENFLQMYWDAANYKSYPRSGSIWTDMISKNAVQQATGAGLTAPVYSQTMPGYFTFLNGSGTTYRFNPYTTITSSYDQQFYTRLAWIRIKAYPGQWGPIVQNQIGNNSDMALCINPDGRLVFRQYNNTNSFGESAGDYGVASTGQVLALNTWYQVAMTVARPYRWINFYVNGELDSQVKSINLIGTSANNNIVIGGSAADDYAGGRMFNGDISIVMHFNHTLTTSDIRQNFTALRPRFGI